jgi:hypothetical protein
MQASRVRSIERRLLIVECGLWTSAHDNQQSTSTVTSTPAGSLSADAGAVTDAGAVAGTGRPNRGLTESQNPCPATASLFD